MYDPYDEGWRAYHCGESQMDNPYDYHTEQYAEWRQGFWDAEEEEYI